MFYERYPDGIPHCENVESQQHEGCAYDPAAAVTCLDELGGASACDGYNYGPWRDVCIRVWSECP